MKFLSCIHFYFELIAEADAFYSRPVITRETILIFNKAKLIAVSVKHRCLNNRINFLQNCIY